MWSKGFGTKDDQSKKKPPSKASISKRIQKTYGGTTSQDILLGTQKAIEKSIEVLPSHIRLALQLYQKLIQWDAQLSTASLLQRATIPQDDMEGARRAREELNRIYNEYSLTDIDMHNTLQKITWDASADAKAARALTGEMPVDIEKQIRAACDIVYTAVGSSGRCLDVGCGVGVLIPFLKASGLSPKQIVGIDLSPEMIRNARSLYPEVRFEICDFLSFDDHERFDGVIFCASLHDMPDIRGALMKAAELLRCGGKLVIVHPQGASHVLNQSKSNPVLVRRGLPHAAELKEILCDLVLRTVPTSGDIPSELNQGYLAVMEKT